MASSSSTGNWEVRCNAISFVDRVRIIHGREMKISAQNPDSSMGRNPTGGFCGGAEARSVECSRERAEAHGGVGDHRAEERAGERVEDAGGDGDAEGVVGEG